MRPNRAARLTSRAMSATRCDGGGEIQAAAASPTTMTSPTERMGRPYQSRSIREKKRSRGSEAPRDDEVGLRGIVVRDRLAIERARPSERQAGVEEVAESELEVELAANARVVARPGILEV